MNQTIAFPIWWSWKKARYWWYSNLGMADLHISRLKEENLINTGELLDLEFLFIYISLFRFRFYMFAFNLVLKICKTWLILLSGDSRFAQFDIWGVVKYLFYFRCFQFGVEMFKRRVMIQSWGTGLQICIYQGGHLIRGTFWLFSFFSFSAPLTTMIIKIKQSGWFSLAQSFDIARLIKVTND